MLTVCIDHSGIDFADPGQRVTAAYSSYVNSGMAYSSFVRFPLIAVRHL